MDRLSRCLPTLVLIVLAALLTGCGGGDPARPPASAEQAQARPQALASAAVDVEAFFDWAERTFPDQFSGTSVAGSYPPYRYRYYPRTGNYIGVAGETVSILGPLSGGYMMNIGTLQDFACRVSPAACGGGGGFALAASVARAEPMQRIDLTPAGGADTRVDYSVEFDVSGSAAFAAADVIAAPALVMNGRIVVSAPVLEMARKSGTAPVPASFALRVRRGSDGVASEMVSIGYDRLVIPAERRGAPSTLLRLVLKALFTEQGGVLATRAAQIRPGALHAATAGLTGNTSLADLQAEAILRQVFGYTTIAKPLAVRRGVLGWTGLTQRPMGAIDSFKKGFDEIFDCLGQQWDENAADDCFDTARKAVRDDFIPNYSTLGSKLASAAGLVTAFASRGVARFVGPFVERLVAQNELNEHAVDLAQAALTLPVAGASSEEAMDFIGDKITEKAKKKLYDKITENLGEATQNGLELVDASDEFGELIDGVGDRARELGDNLFAFKSDSDRMQDLGAEFGDTEAPAAPTEIPLGIGGGSVTVAVGQTPASICQANPDMNASVQSLGFSSCEAYLRPFFDAAFAGAVLKPMLDQLAAIDFGPCLANPEAPGCDALFEQVSALTDRLLGAIRSHDSKDFTCDAGYTTFENRSDGLTCVFSPLVYPRPGTNCNAGSNPAPFDVGGANVCVYYSRDYIRGGMCRTNYSKVDFQGVQTCRWSTLAIGQPAAYAINRYTGDRVALVP